MSEEKRKREWRGRMRKKERKEMKETNDFFLQSTAFRQSEFVGPRSKVHIRGKATLQEVGIFHTLVFFPL